MDIEGIKSQFGDLGFEDVSDSVLDKCVELCALYNIDEETFVETWMAYSITNLGGEAPTLETLSNMERKEFANQDKTNTSNTTGSRSATTPLTIYNKTPTSNKKAPVEKRNQLDNTPKGTKNAALFGKHLSTPVSQSNFSPSSFSPLTTTPSGKYSARTNAGDTVAEFLDRASGDWVGKERVELTIAPYRDEVLSARCRIMMEPLSEKAAVLDDVIERIGSYLVEMNGLQDPTYNHNMSSTEMVCVGRVCCDSNDHLNSSSVMLEGSLDRCRGQSVPLDLSRLTHYALFPGQVVAVVGVNPTGKRLIATKLHYSAPLPSPTRLPRFTAPIEMVIAAGPFTQSDSLAYEPLEDLMRYVASHRPHVLILIGPLVDLRHPQLSAGSIAETYEDYYNKILKGIVDQLKGSWTQVVVVSSADDAVCLPVFPTPPPPTQQPSPPLHLVSDPALLTINGLVIALTATDSLMHLGKEEISFSPGSSDRLGRLASHLLEQQHLYPLWPPSEDLTVDSELWDSHASLPVTPHVLVAPSHFRYFIKHLHNCLVVNPERLTKGTAGGTFARLEVEPPTDDVWTPASHISAQIIRI